MATSTSDKNSNIKTPFILPKNNKLSIAYSVYHPDWTDSSCVGIITFHRDHTFFRSDNGRILSYDNSGKWSRKDDQHVNLNWDKWEVVY